MKKIFVLFIVVIYMFSMNVNAYSLVNVSNNTVKYEAEFAKKVDFTKISKLKLQKLKVNIENLINKFEVDIKKTDSQKEKLLWQLIALNNLINRELEEKETVSNITVTIIDDKRCTNCMTKEIVSQLKLVPFLTSSKFIEKDFSEIGVSDYLKENNITKLPTVILSTNNISDEWLMKPYLKELADKQYSLEIWASFDPFAKRSDKWFLILDKEILNKIKSNTYLKWNKDTKISWIEYSDLECPYCAKLHNSDVSTKIKETYEDKVNTYFNHFPLDFHQNAMPAARIVECLAEQKGAESYYILIDNSFSNENSQKEYLISEAIKLWADKVKLEKCVDEKKYDIRILEQQSLGTSTFGISWTPANILINNETWEYQILSWAYPFNEFQKVIDELLK